MADFNSIKIDKSMYARSGKNLTQQLEEMDPSANYRGTELEGLDAFQRQLKRFDIKVKGRNSDTVEKFFQTGDSAALFPEFIRRGVLTGIDQGDMLGDIVATTTRIEGMDYRSITSDQTEAERELAPVAEGAYIPETRVRLRENLVRLIKRGRMLVSSYEALRYQRLDVFTVTLRQIGSYIGQMLLKDAVDVLINGDGNDNAAQVLTPTLRGSVSYKDLIKLWGELSPYELNTILAPTEVVKKILAVPEMQDAAAGLNFHGTGKMVTPMGATLIHVPSVPENHIIGFDKNFALEMVQSGDIVMDYDKLIDHQLERAAITCTCGFAKLFDSAVKVLTI